jgi:hypothetical protein
VKWHPSYSITIKAAPGENPVFDGNCDGYGGAEPLGWFIHFRLRVNAYVNILIEGLTIRNYLNNALVLDGWNSPSSPCPYTFDSWNGGFEIRNNVFIDIGDAAFQDPSRATCAGYTPPYEHLNTGFAGIQLSSSNDNRIHHNVFTRLYDCTESEPIGDFSGNHGNEIHTIYANSESNGNWIAYNFVDDQSGDAFKFRAGSDHNILFRNYVHRGFQIAPGQEYRSVNIGEVPVEGNTFVENLVTYPYQYYSVPYDGEGGVFACLVNRNATCEDRSIPGSSFEPCPRAFTVDPYTQDRLIDFEPTHPEVTAATSFDAEGDETVELVVALDGDGVSRVLRSKLRPYFLGDVLWSSVSGDRVLAMTSGDFDGDGDDELITAIDHADGSRRIWAGTGAAWGNGLTNLGMIYESPSGSGWTIKAMTAGNFTAGPGDELLTAFEIPNETRVYLGHGTGANGATDISIVYQLANSWKISAMATGDFGTLSSGSQAGDGVPDVATAFSIPGETRVYVGNGTDSLTLREIFRSTTDHVTAMAAGELDGDGDTDLMTALQTGDTVRVYRGNGWSFRSQTLNGAVTWGQLYTSTTWKIPFLITSEFRAGGAHEVATVFIDPTRIQIWAGDGSSGLVSHWKFYELDW